nr:hypothetical protein [Burkholderia stabilis]
MDIEDWTPEAGLLRSNFQNGNHSHRLGNSWPPVRVGDAAGVRPRGRRSAPEQAQRLDDDTQRQLACLRARRQIRNVDSEGKVYECRGAIGRPNVELDGWAMYKDELRRKLHRFAERWCIPYQYRHGAKNIEALQFGKPQSKVRAVARLCRALEQIDDSDVRDQSVGVCEHVGRQADSFQFTPRVQA